MWFSAYRLCMSEPGTGPSREALAYPEEEAEGPATKRVSEVNPSEIWIGGRSCDWGQLGTAMIAGPGVIYHMCGSSGQERLMFCGTGKWCLRVRE